MTTPLTANMIYLPTIDACWDYGFQRNNQAAIPFVGSFLPYSFLRGTQFETKLFKLSELAEFFNLMPKFPVNEVLLIPNEYDDDVLKALAGKNLPSVQPVGLGASIVANLQKTPGVPGADAIASVASFLNAPEFRIAVENEGFEFNVSNNWKAGGDQITQILSKTADTIGTVANLLSGAAEANDNKQFPIAQVPYSPARYNGTEPIEVTINFNLFTRNNYFRDIFVPVQLLQVFCMPQTYNPDTVKRLYDYIKSSKDAIAASAAFAIDNEIATQTIDFLASTFDKVLGAYQNRIKIVRPPPTFQVYHSGKAFKMNRGAVKNLKIEFKGPWIKQQYDGLFGTIFRAAPRIGTSLDRLLQDVYTKIYNVPDSTYPTVCSVSITFMETAFMTANDYAQDLLNPLEPKILAEAISDIAGDRTFASLVAGGVAQGVSSAAPLGNVVGDLLAGGKWIPPGEGSMLGIPGIF
jgi:hypothetical protein